MRRIIATLIFTTLLIAGCSDSNRPSDLPTLYPFVVTITQEGNPLSGASVMLIPMEGTQAKYQASANTDSSGKATLVTYGFDGVPAGKYKVCVRRVVSDENTGAEFQTVEREYSDPERTPHEIEITNKKMPPASFDVGKAIKERK